MELHLRNAVCAVCVLLLNATGSLSQLEVCGQSTFNNKIVGGGDAVTGAWPWQASIQKGSSHFCGGSLINNKWVLSAAHCFERYGPLDVTVKLGLKNLHETNSYTQSIQASQIISHPDYNSRTNDNDIALIQLLSFVTFTNYVKPVCLAAAHSVFPARTEVWVTGWGDIKYGVELPYPQSLQEVELPIVSNADCKKSYGSTITGRMMCAGLMEGGKDSCQGDSGGPLVIQHNVTWVQGGIVSFGEECALARFPGVYTRVSEYQTWIKDQISSNQPGFVTVSHGSRGSPSLTCLSLSIILFPLYRL